MKVVSRIGLIAFTPVLLALAVAAIQFYASGQVDLALERSARAQHLQEDIVTLNLLMNEVGSHPLEVRPKRQWYGKYRELVRLLKSMSEEELGRADQLRRLRSRIRELETQFARIEGAVVTDIRADIRDEQIGGIISLMLLTTRQVLDEVRQLVDEANADMYRVRYWSDIGILAAVVMMVLMLGGMAFIMGRRVIEPVLSLREGTERIGAGDLDYRLDVPAQTDELTDLAHAFNQMLARLRATLASRDELNREVAARKRSEEELRSAHRQLQGIIEFLPDATFVIDRDKRVVAWNRAMEEMTGVAKKEMLGRGGYAYAEPFYGECRPVLIDLLDGPDPEVETRYDYVTTEADRLTAELFIPGLFQGRGAHVLMAASPLYDAAGERFGAVESVRDISLLKQAEDERIARLRQVQLQQATVLELSTTPSIANGELTGAFALISERCAEVIGSERVSLWLFEEEHGRMRCVELFQHGEHDQSGAALLSLEQYPHYFAALESGRAIDADDAANDPRTAEFDDGYLKAQGIYSMLDAPIRVGGTVRGIVCHESLRPRAWSPEEVSFAAEMADQAAQAMANDERYRTEEEIRVAREYLRNVINSMPAMLLGLDGEGRITHWNHRAEVFSGRAESEVLGLSLAEVELLPEAIMAPVLEAIDSGKSRQLLSQGFRHEGRHVSVDITVYPVAVNGSGGSVLLLDDVTERVRVESMMVQTEKMMSVGGLAAGMAHELNSPLGGMLQGMQNIQRRLSPELAKNRESAEAQGIELESLAAYLDERGVTGLMQGVIDAGRRASDIVANMMNFSRTLSETVTPIDMRELLDSVVELASLDYDLKKKHGFREISILREYADDLPYVPCLEKEIKQVILNLLRNAAQALSGWAERREAPRITLRTRREGEMACIEVEDNGPGMSAAIREHIFEPFFTTREVGEGTGLGLSVAYYLIHEQHHGTIEVESEPGAGARFIIRLPLAAPN